MLNSIFQENEINKSNSLKENTNLNDLLSKLSTLLKPVQIIKQKDFLESKWPIGFIIGNPRSGTTLMLQWMASLGYFSYPTNVLNRFAYAPYLGALIQKMLFDPIFDFSGELSDINSSVNFNSNLGKSRGALATNEFQHFFRNHMSNFDPQHLDKRDIVNVDLKKIKQGLSSIEAVFEKPFVVKLMMLQYNLLDVYKYIPNAIYIYVKREPIYNMQSILRARLKYYNDENIWWSVKPKEYKFLKDMDIYHQIAGQVYYTNNAIEESLEKIPTSRKIKIEYEKFCTNPHIVYNKIRDLYNELGLKLPIKYEGVRSFEISNTIHLSNEEITKLKNAYNYFKNR